MSTIHPHSSTSPSTASALLAEWRRLTLEGNDARQTQCVAHALAWHEQALRVAHQLLFRHAGSIEVTHDDRLAAFVVAHLNLAECLEAMDQKAQAAECLRCAHHRLVALMQSEDESEAMRLAACHHIRYTWAALNSQGAQPSDATHDADALPRSVPHIGPHHSTSLH
ncbi:hypothetical protein [Diaphorobacter caeni]|uniref:hypothetical protein n=1 Tax=Diaphorobacter caeni TaxID=2784387 RepID=UPI00189015E8|nr:hypothetical protein [Diaphorobacter caeni]MBF5005634.1 hypothetical protein [Diaphorobacter caeni]